MARRTEMRDPPLRSEIDANSNIRVSSLRGEYRTTSPVPDRLDGEMPLGYSQLSRKSFIRRPEKLGPGDSTRAKSRIKSL